MREKIELFRNIFFLAISAMISIASANSTHLNKIKSIYPYGLIGDDFGILNWEDLAVNTCFASMTPFSEDKSMAYSYWQCFLKADVKVECESLGYEPSVKMELAYFNINVKNKIENNLEKNLGFKTGERVAEQSYLARDPMDIRSCKELLKSYKRKTQIQKYVCISGSFNSLELLENGQREVNWVFDKFKNKKGCEAYKSECELEVPYKKSCIVPKTKF